MKQKLMSILLVLCMVVALMPAIALTSAAANTSAGKATDGTLPAGATIKTDTATAFSGGDGSDTNPYEIKDVTEFRYFQSLLLGDNKAEYLTRSYKLTGDIVYNDKFDCMGENGFPLNYTNNSLNRFSAKGNGDSVACAVPGTFSGTFDGNGKGIYNCYMRFSGAGGFFEMLSGTVENLNFYGGYVYFGDGTAAGTIAAVLAGGTISNCFSSVNVYAKGQYTAGIAGHVTTADSMINDCTYAGSINASSVGSYYQVAGIAARVETGLTVSGCANRANMTAGCSRVGGIVGMMNAGGKKLSIQNCANYGNLTTTHTENDHGIAGIFAINNTGNIEITGCANYGSITGTAKCRAAGIVGGSSASGWTIRNCANYGDISGLGASGVCVYSNGGTYANNYAEGTYSQPGNMASSLLIGWVKSATTIQNSVGVGKNLYQKNTDVVTESNNKTYAVGSLNIAEAVAILNTGLETPAWVAGKTAPELKWIADMNATPAPEIGIDGASLTISGNVTMNLFVKKSTVADAGVTLNTISIVDNDGTAYKVTDDNDNYYVFTISGIHASEFGTNKIYHVQYTTADAPATAIDCTATKEYSPLQYAINMYNADKDVETVTDLDKLLLSIVNYADAAAKSTDASTAFKAAHTDADFSTLPTFAKIIDEDKGVYTYDELKDDKNLPGIAAELTETIALIFTFDGSDSYEKDNSDMMMIGDTAIEGKLGALSVVFSGLFATDLYNTITLTFKETYDNGLTVQATTSLVQFLKSYQGTAEETLATATAQYLYAARLFCLNNQPNA